jgi:polar amino acid transport system permease protein
MPAHKNNRYFLDIFIGLALILALIWLIQRIKSDLVYQWDWSAIWQYLFRYDPQKAQWTPNLLMYGFFTTIRLSVWATLMALMIGTVMGIMGVSRSPINRFFSRLYVESVRNMPPLVLIFIFYYFLSDLFLPVLAIEQFFAKVPDHLQPFTTFFLGPSERIVPFVSALLTLAIFEGAYITEIVRAGIRSIDGGQWEASSALGMTRYQQLRKAILPQTVQRILPPLAGQFISTIKDSAIVAVISIPDLTFQGMELMAATYLTFEVWIIITAMYLLLTLPCSLAIRRLELYFGRYAH